jgi:hypothetical protein
LQLRLLAEQTEVLVGERVARATPERELGNLGDGEAAQRPRGETIV